MKLLLDTHVVLWVLSEPNRLSEGARTVLVDETNDVFVSAATAWEIAIKQSLGKLTLPDLAARWLPSAIAQTGLAWMSISADHALGVGALPWHHKDPFDRLLVVQAKLEGCTLVTHDRSLEGYGASLLLV